MRLEKGKSIGAALKGGLLGGLKGAARSTPFGGAAMGFMGALGVGGGGGGAPRARRRSRGMYVRKGRLFMGFSQSDVKNAMRQRFGGRRRKK